ncbi:YDG domain-containing protein [Tsuneonella amylolytica]|uniref:YDG domain-containing protein n=1 Tax=Tsuneonella amylolytica TaxID=2338327 RepID=UPI000EAA9B09|nr:YDG domain-containing protein [Tsuneonella amylolytica]
MLARNLRTVLATSVALPLFALAAPAMGQLVNSGDLVTAQDSAGNPGQITISNPDANTANISVLAPVVVANWNQFNVPGGTTLNVTNGSAAAQASLLNRVIGGSFSDTGGTINAADVNLWLINPNGILFGNNTSVNASSFYASTLSVTDADFFDFYEGTNLAGNGSGSVQFSTNPASSTFMIAPSGTKFVTDGTLFFASPGLSLTGTFDAGTGAAAFVAATDVTVNFTPGSPISYTLNAGTTIASQEIGGTVKGNSADFVFVTSAGAMNALLTVDADVATTATAGTNGIRLIAQGAAMPDVDVNGALSTTGDLTANVSGDLTFAQAANSGAITLNVGDMLTADDLTATSGLATLNAETIDAGGVSAAGGIRFQTDNAGSATFDSLTSSGGSVQVNGLVPNTVTVSGATSGTSVFLIAINGLQTGSATSTAGTVNLTSLSGSVSSGAITATGGNATVGAAGAVTAASITSTTGAIDVDSTGGGNLSLGALNAATNITLDTSGSVQGTTAVAGGAFTIGDSVDPSSISFTGALQAGSFDFDATGAITIQNATATNGSIDFDSGSINGGALAATGAILLDATGTIALVSAAANSDGTGAEGVAIGATTMPSSLTISGPTSGAFVDLQASGNLNLGSVTSAVGTVDVDSTNGAISAGAVSATGGDALLTAGNGITATSIASTTGAVDVDSTAGGNLNLGNLAAATTLTADTSGSVTFGSATAGGAFAVGGSVDPSSITASGNISAGSVDFDSTGALNALAIAATAGGIDIDTASTRAGALAATGAITVDGTGAVTLASATADSDDNGSGTLTIGGTTTPSSLTITGAAQGVAAVMRAAGAVQLGDVTSTNGAIDIDSIASTITAGAVSATAGDAALTAPGAITTASITTITSGSIAVDSMGGGALDLGNLTSAGSIDAGTSGAATAGTVSAVGNFAIGDSMRPSSLVLTGDATAATIRLRAGGDITTQNLSGASFKAIAADGGRVSTGDITTTSNSALVTIEARGATGYITTGDIANGGSILAVSAEQDIVVGDVTNPAPAGFVAATALFKSGGSTTIGDVSTGEDLVVRAGTEFTGGNLIAGDDVDVIANGTISIASATATGTGPDANRASLVGSPGSVTSVVFAAETLPGSNIALTSTGGSVIATGALSAADAIDVDSGAGGALTLGDLSAGTSIALDGGGALTFGNVSGGAASLAIGSTLAPSSVASSGSIVVTSFTANTGGALTLSGANRIDTLAGLSAGGTVMVNTLADLSVTGPVTATGQDVTLKTTGDLTVSSGGSVTGRIVALSADGNFINDRGADAITASDHWVVYSNGPAGNTFGNLDSGNTAIWNATIATLAPGAVSGNRYVFAFQPTLTISSTSLSKVYGTDLTGMLDGYYTASGFQPGVAGAYLADTATNTLSGSPTITSVGAAERADVAGSPYVMDIELGTLAAARGYAIALSDAGTLTVTPKPVTASAAADDKTYDGTTAGTGSISSAGFLSGDDVTITGTTYTFSDKNVGVDKTVTISGAMLSGSDAGNYSLTVPASTLADIFAKAIGATVVADDKTYDGTASATGSVSLNGVVAGDDLGASGTTFAFSDKNAVTDKTVIVSGTTLTGADAGNYVLTVPATTLADIFARAIGATVSADDKTYDGTTAATGSVALTGVLAGDDLGTSGTTFTFSDKNAGPDKTVTIGGTTLTGTDAGNYVVTVPATTLADIFAKAISTTVVANDKTYDGTTAATGSVSLVGVVAGDSVDTAGTTFAFSDKNAGADKTVVIAGTTLTGADAGNYTLTIPASTLADIFAKAISATVVANDKTYDGTTAGTGSVSLVGVVSGDSVATSGTTFTFADKNAGTDKSVTISGTTLTGADAGNYTVNVPTSAMADILAKAITATASANDKTYDGTTVATGSLVLTGIVASDSVGTSGTAFAFADKNAGTDKIVTASGTTLTGTDAGNYTLTGTSTALADILAKAITGSVSVNDKVYDGTIAATGTVTLTGVVAGDAVSTTGTTFTFVDPNAGTDKTVRAAGTSLAGVDSGNYTLTLPTTALADILRRAIEIVAVDGSKSQGQIDPALTYTVGGAGLVAGDSLTGTLQRAPGEIVGNYAIGQGSVTAGANYTITFIGGTFTVRPTPVPNTLRTLQLPSEVERLGGGSGISIQVDDLCPKDDRNCTL